MRAGDLRRRLTLERASDSTDDAGGAVRTWVPEGAVFAAVKPRSRRDTVENGRSVGLVSHFVMLRFRDDLGGDVRFVDGDAVYRVLAVEAFDPQRRYVRCLCEEGQA